MMLLGSPCILEYTRFFSHTRSLSHFILVIVGCKIIIKMSFTAIITVLRTNHHGGGDFWAGTSERQWGTGRSAAVGTHSSIARRLGGAPSHVEEEREPSKDMPFQCLMRI